MTESLTNFFLKKDVSLSNTNIKSDQIDKRIRIRSKPGQESIIYGNPNLPTNPLAILHQTNGIIFPYTPTITIDQNIQWDSRNLVHSLQDFYYFTTINSVKISISGHFTIQNNYEGRYLFAVFHFFRSYSKMYFGTRETEEKRGLPPPILLLDGYGDMFFNSLPVIIKNWRFTFDEDINYVRVVLNDEQINRRSSIINNSTVNNPSVNKLSSSVIKEQQITQDYENIRIEASRTPNLLNSPEYQRLINKIENQRKELTVTRETLLKQANASNNIFNNQVKSEFETAIKNNKVKNIITVTPNNANFELRGSQTLSSNLGYCYLPVATTLSLELTVQRPPNALKREFNLQDFREGRLLGSKKGFF